MPGKQGCVLSCVRDLGVSQSPGVCGGFSDAYEYSVVCEASLTLDSLKIHFSVFLILFCALSSGPWELAEVVV